MEFSSQIPNTQSSVASSEGLSPEAMSALSYLCGIVAVVALCVAPHNQNAKVRFHAYQSLLLLVAWVGGYLAIGMVSIFAGLVFGTLLAMMGLHTILSVLALLPTLVSSLLTLTVCGTWIYLIISAAQGREVRLPVLGNAAMKLAGR